VSVHRHTISQAKALGHFLLDLGFFAGVNQLK
jgi:hypothetical protein